MAGAGRKFERSHATNTYPSPNLSDPLTVREQHPLVRSIPKFVVINCSVNVLLAVGASPVMGHIHEEMAIIAKPLRSISAVWNPIEARACALP